jgi:hypothetical protein
MCYDDGGNIMCYDDEINEDEESRYYRLNRPREARKYVPDCSTCTADTETLQWLCGECYDTHNCGGYTHVQDLGYMCDICGGIYIYDI